MRVTTLAQNALLKQNVNSIQGRLLTLYGQISSEKISTEFSGLRSQTRVTLDLRTRITSMETFRTNIAAARVRTTTSETVLTEIGEMATDLRTDALSLKNGGTPNPTLIAQDARGTIDRVITLMNTRLQDRFIFGGIDISTRPMLDSAPSHAATQAALAGYTDGDAAGRLANIRAYFDNETNFYAGDNSAERPTTRVDEGLDVNFGLRGDSDGLKRMFAGLYTLANLTYDPAAPNGFFTLLDGALADIKQGTDLLNAELGRVGNQLGLMEDLEARFNAVEVVFAQQISSIEDVDVAAAVSDLNATDAQLQATYRVIATTRSLNLANFL